MNSLVFFEIILSLVCLLVVVQIKPAMTLSRIFWSAGFFSIAIAALLGAFKYAGIQQVAPYHGYAATFAGSLGLVSLAIGGLLGVWPARPLTLGAFWYVFHGAVAVAAVLSSGVPIIQTIQYGAVCILFILGVFDLAKGRSVTGLYMVGGVGCFILANMASERISAVLGFELLNVYHLLLTAAVYLMGSAVIKK